jgi:DNA-directed RNA polymerase subunit RPC12/RpoP
MIEIDSTWYERCGDCGQAVIERKKSRRESICDECWERREWLVKNLKTMPIKEFQAIQKSMAYKTGTAKRKILKLMCNQNIGILIDNFADMDD